MFQELRNNSKKFIWVVAAAFIGLIFLVWGDFISTRGSSSSSGNQRTGEVGRVNGEAIDANAYQRLVNITYQNVAAQSGQQVDEQTATLIKNQAWNNLVQESLLRREARERDIRVTNDEIIDAVLNDPPADFRSVPQFQTDGQFDLSKYQALMRSPTFDSRPIEASFQASLPLDKLQQQVMATAVISEEELWQDFQLKNDNRKISYLRVSSADFVVDESGIDDATLEAHYAAHSKEYRVPAEATVEYVSFSKTYSTEDSLGIYDLAESLIEDTKRGDDLLDLMDLSEAPANQRGGETAAWISPNSLAPAVRSAVAALPAGEISEVIIEPRGFHIVRIEEKREDATAGSQIKIADVFLPLRANPETLTAIRENAVGFRTEVGNGDLTATAAEYEVSVQQTNPFRERGFVAGLGSAPEVQRFAFRNPVGTVSPPMERPNDWLVVRVTDRQDTRIPELADVRDRVRREAADLLRREKAATKAEQILPRVQAGEDMASIAIVDSLVTFDTVESVTRLGARGVGSDPDLLGPVFAVESGLIGRVLSARAGAFIVKVEEATSADRAAFDSQKLDLRRSLLQQRQTQLMTEWLNGLQAAASVQDFRFGAF